MDLAGWCGNAGTVTLVRQGRGYLRVGRGQFFRYIALIDQLNGSPSMVSRILLPTLLFLLVVVTLPAQNVGIGTSTPVTTLEINGPLTIPDGAFGNNSLRFKGANTGLFRGADDRVEFVASGLTAGIQVYPNHLRVQRGTLGSPGIAWMDNTSTGIFGPALNTIAFDITGVEYARMIANGNMGFGTNAPTTKVHINSAVSPAFRLVDGTQANGRVLTSDANGNATWMAAGAATGWSLTGNALGANGGTNGAASTNFIGTTDGRDFIIRTNNLQQMRFYSAPWNGAGFYPIMIGPAPGPNVFRMGLFNVTGTMGASCGNQPVVRVENTGNFGCAHGIDIILAGHAAGAIYEWYMDGGGANTGAVQANGGGVFFNTTSDRRLKENIVPASTGLAELMKIGVYEYNFIGYPDQHHTGFIAQELYAQYPYAVSKPTEDAEGSAHENPWRVDYGQVTPLIVKSVQEQQVQIEALQQENKELKAQLAELEDLKAAVRKLEASLVRE
jgi:hypothetical protein